MHLDIEKWKALGEPKLEMFFNGREIKHVVELNEEEGWVIIEVRDKHGDILIDEINDCILTKKLEGEVKVVIDESINWLGDPLGTPTQIKRSEVNIDKSQLDSPERLNEVVEELGMKPRVNSYSDLNSQFNVEF